MSGRMNWRAAQLRDRASMNVKREQDVRSQDRAAKWLETAERRLDSAEPSRHRTSPRRSRPARQGHAKEQVD